MEAEEKTSLNRKDVEQVAQEVATAMQMEDYTIANQILKQYDYSFKKKVDALMPPSLKRKFEVLCP